MNPAESPVSGAQVTPRPHKSVTEATRERETFKYATFCIEAQLVPSLCDVSSAN
jgi:hypothetical protein